MSFNDETVYTAQTPDNSFWPVIREAIRGSDRDFTVGSVGLAIFLLAVPMIFEMLAESLFAIVDIFFVAKLGAGAVAIVGLTESVMALIYAVAFGLAIAATATIARRTGEKDHEGAAKSAVHVIYFGIGVSLVISAIGIIFAPNILSPLGADPRIIEIVTVKTRQTPAGAKPEKSARVLRNFVNAVLRQTVGNRQMLTRQAFGANNGEANSQK